MRIKIRFTCNGSLIVPYSYNEIIQGWIYRHLQETLAVFIHDEGFKYENRRFKLFTFSRLLGKTVSRDGSFIITPPVELVVSSPYHRLLQSLAENILLTPEIELNRKKLLIESISVGYLTEINEEVEIKMLSPVTVYSTFKTPDGRKKTYYYNPKEEEFAELLKQNILKKFTAFYGHKPESEAFNITPLRVSKRDEKIVTYKGFVIKGWMGRYRLSGSPELLRLAYDAGLGPKNSQGFGCFEVVG